VQLANQYARRMQALCDEVDRVYTALNSEQSRYDKQVSGIYHELEKVELDEASGFAAVVTLQDVLRKRRVIKDEFTAIDRLRAVMSGCMADACKELSRQADKHARWCADFRITLSISDVIDEEALINGE
jgi:hypothetical protein